MSAAADRDFDVVIVGAGVVGTVMGSLLLARKLSAAGRVAILADRFGAAPPADADWDLRVFALSRASERLLRACGVWDALPAPRVCAYERMCVWDAAGEPGGRGSLCFDCAEIGEPNLGFIVDGRILQWQCLQAARSAGVVLLEATLESIAAADSGVSIRLSDGRTLRSQLLIAADGQESKTRALLGIETAGHAYHQDALVAHVRTAQSHRNTAWQRFLGSGPLAFLPLTDGRSSIVWSAALPEAARLRALDAQAFGAALSAASGEVLGSCEVSTAAGGLSAQAAVRVGICAPARRAARGRRARGTSLGRPGNESGAAGLRLPRRSAGKRGSLGIFRRAQAAAAL